MDSEGDISGQLENISLGDITTEQSTADRRAASPPPVDTQPELGSAQVEAAELQQPEDGDRGDMGWTPPVKLQATEAPEEEQQPEGDLSAAADASGEDFSAVDLQDDVGAGAATSTTSTSSPPATPPLSESTSTTPADPGQSVSALSSAAGPITSTPPHSPAKGKTPLPAHTTSIAVSTEAGTEAPAPAEAEPSTSSSPAKTAAAPATPTAQPRLGTHTPNVLQKLVSMTRQRDLPPKAREEEKKHLRELEEMRTAAKEAEKRRQASLAAAAALRAAKLASAFPTWESSILPNWRSVLHPEGEGPALHKLWWEGTMPVRWRGRLWSMCIGNGLAVSKGGYSSALGRWEAAEGGEEKDRAEELLLEDVEGTLEGLKLFQKGGVMHDELCALLRAASWWLATKDGGTKPPRYPTGMASPAAMLLVNLPGPDAWVSLVNLINKSYLKSFYSDDTEETEAYYRIFDTLLADSMPKIYENFSKEVVRPALFLFPWLTTVYVSYLPLDLSTRLFDNFLLEGDSFIFRVALVLLRILEPRLFNPVLSELDAVFKGEDRGAVAIVKRQRPDESGEVSKEEVYAEMGVSEQTVFEGLEGLNWREETWERLVTRELPEAD